MPETPEASESLFRKVDGRLRVELHLDDSSEHTLWCELSMNVAEGGVFIATHQPIQLGTEIDLELHLPTKDGGGAVSGVVRWSRPYREGSDAPAGVGIKFSALDRELCDRLSEFAQNVREPIFFNLEDVPIRSRSRSAGSRRRLSDAPPLG